jgi:hypothetical protein
MIVSLPLRRSLAIIGGLLMVFIISSCLGLEETPKPDNLIAEENYIDLLVEMQHIITYRNAKPDSISADSLKDIVYEKFGITEEQYAKSHAYYQQHVDRQLQRIDEAIRRLEGEENYIKTHIDSVQALPKDTTTTEADSASFN